MAHTPLGTSWNGRARQALVRETLTIKGRTCHLCGLPGATTADHITPRVHGGLSVLANLAPAHYSCNSSRGARTLDEWFQAKPALAAVVRGARQALPPSREW